MSSTLKYCLLIRYGFPLQRDAHKFSENLFAEVLNFRNLWHIQKQKAQQN